MGECYTCGRWGRSAHTKTAPRWERDSMGRATTAAYRGTPPSTAIASPGQDPKGKGREKETEERGIGGKNKRGARAVEYEEEEYEEETEEDQQEEEEMRQRTKNQGRSGNRGKYTDRCTHAMEAKKQKRINKTGT